MMGGGLACEYEEIHTLSQCVRLAAHRHNAVHTLSLRSKVNGRHGNSR